MSKTILRLTLVAIVAGCLAAPPIPAEQQDQAWARQRVAPANATTGVVIRRYQITASEGGIVPGHLRAKLGEKVRITFVSRDDTYGIRFKDFGVKEKLTPQRPVVVELLPQSVGTFEFGCTRSWGVKRFSKNGALVVER